jgi:hypothetical protein
VHPLQKRNKGDARACPLPKEGFAMTGVCFKEKRELRNPS